MTKPKPKGTPKGRKGIKSNLPKDPKTGKVLPSKGRPKGTPNRITAEAKTMIGLAFEGLGGLQALIDTADKSDSLRMIFYTQLYAKLIPIQIQGKIDATIEGDGKLLAATMVDALTRVIASRRSGGEGVGIIIDNTTADESVPQLVLSRKAGTEAA